MIENKKVRWLAPINAICVLFFLLVGCLGGKLEGLAPAGVTEAVPHLTLEMPPLTQTEPTPPTMTAVPSPTLVQTTAVPPPTSFPTKVPSRTLGTQLPDPSGYAWSPVVEGLQWPVGLANAGDGSNRLFVLEQDGVIQVIKDGDLLFKPFLDITDRVGSEASEQGLLGLAFHPRYNENGYFYVNYTDVNGDTVVARYSVSGDPDRADLGSEVRLLYIDQPYRNHNGGMVAFGPGGYLYLGLGDGGSAGDPLGNAQSLNTLLGKILRLDVDSGDPYTIPPDNPFASGGSLPEIWAYGLRNPWRFAFDRLTGDLYIGDVGQGHWEEIDFLPAGSPGGINFGWDYREGAHPFEGSPLPGLVLIDPVAEYDHSSGCSVTGGVVYRGSDLPEWQGAYLYGDYCSGRVWGLIRTADSSWQSVLLFETDARITSFGEDESGEVFLVDHQGTVYRLVNR